MAALPAGCATQTPTEPPTAIPTQTPTEETTPPTRIREGPIAIAFVPKNLGNPYFDEANKGAQEAAAELGIEVTYTGPATADAAEQIQLLNSLIAQGVDGLAISANEADALVPVGRDAMAQGIPVVSWDSAIAEGGRTVHINQATMEGIARALLEMASRLAGGEGQIAILSATACAPNQMTLCNVLQWMLRPDEAFRELELVDTVYGDDEDEKSYNEVLGLMTRYPDLEVIIAPTTVGIANAARAVQDQGKIGQVFVTGLGTPNQMREYVKSGAAPEFALFNPIDLGYLTIYATYHLVVGDIGGKPGDTFNAGRLGSYTVNGLDVVGVDGNVIGTKSEVLLGPYIFNADNIDDFDF